MLVLPSGTLRASVHAARGSCALYNCGDLDHAGEAARAGLGACSPCEQPHQMSQAAKWIPPFPSLSLFLPEHVLWD